MHALAVIFGAIVIFIIFAPIWIGTETAVNNLIQPRQDKDYDEKDDED